MSVESPTAATVVQSGEYNPRHEMLAEAKARVATYEEAIQTLCNTDVYVFANPEILESELSHYQKLLQYAREDTSRLL